MCVLCNASNGEESLSVPQTREIWCQAEREMMESMRERMRDGGKEIEE